MIELMKTEGASYTFHKQNRSRFAFGLALFVCVSLSTLGGEDKKDKEDPEAFLKSVTLVKGLEAHLFSDKQIVNPTAFCFDDKNRLYVAETMRFRVGGGIDNRAVMFLYFDDIKGTTLAERTALYEKYKDKFPKEYFTKYSERISVLEDTTGSGRADKATVFAEGFNNPLDGPASGIAYRDGKIHLACVPSIWELPDANGDLVADKKEVFFEGFGIRVSISGHDCHGIIWGLDGKLYWSMGDRGYNVKSREGQHYISPGSGGVFRCNADGSDLELYYSGLRNPEELAFNEWGDLFTVDNNADIGDSSRLVYILEGGSNGWDMGWQMLGYGNFAQFAGLGGRQPNPWMLEGLWKTRFDDQPTWILPPIGHITNGPCGFAYNPGCVALNESYSQHFFVADYTAGANSGVHAFKAEEDGAGFKLTHAHKFVWGVTATDVAFGYDGKMYIGDYMGGWHEAIRSKGRIVTVQDNEELKKPAIGELKKIFANGFNKRSIAELAELLKHNDMRVRTRAQWELATRGKDGLKALVAATNSDNVLTRVHGIWGLSQIGKQEPTAISTLITLLGDKEAHVREQAAKRLGDLKCIEAGDKLVPLLKDSSLRVRSFAAITLGKIKHRAAVPALVELIRENDDKDPYLRHTGIVGLAGCGEVAALQPYITDSSRALRLAVLLAYRRLKDPAIAAFLKDSDPLVYAEAIRAIYDLPIAGAMPQLAAELKRHFDPEKSPAKGKMTQLLYLRILNANGRYGAPENAALLAEFAAKANAPEDMRIAALAQLEKWEMPTEVDPIVGQYRPIARRDKALIREAMKSAIEHILANGKDALLVKAATIAASVGISLPEKMLWANLENVQALEALRIESLRQLVEKKDEKLKGSIEKLLNDANENVRIAALDALIQLDPARGIKSAEEILNGKALVKDAVQVVIDRSDKGWNDLKMKGPSKDDYADISSSKGALFSFVKTFAKPHEKAGAYGEHLPRLNDGLAAENNDDLEHNSWLDGGESRIVVDLQKAIEISRINTFSWHRDTRAPQKFFLWGSTNEKPDTGIKDPASKGWTRIATVDTTSLKDGGKHGSSIFNEAGIVGTYRWLMWQNPHRSTGTFFSEIDVYEKGQVLPPLDSAPPDQRIKQQVLLSLGKTNDPSAATMIDSWMERMNKGEVPANLQLDLIEAAATRTEDSVKGKLAKYQKALNQDDKLAPFRITLEGGDPVKGREVFEVSGAQCMRCHKVGEERGGDAGPNLAGVGKRLVREKLLESLIDPNAVVVPGYGIGTFKMNDGTLVTGSVFGENDKELTLKLADGNVQTIKVADIKKRIPPTSPMPAMETVLKPREIRDIISYLATLQTELAPKLEPGGH